MTFMDMQVAIGNPLHVLVNLLASDSIKVALVEGHVKERQCWSELVDIRELFSSRG